MKPRNRRRVVIARQLRRAKVRRWLKQVSSAIHSALDTPDVQWFTLSTKDGL